MTTIGHRLKEERILRNMSQEAFGGVGGVGKHAQINYEKDERSPDVDYLARIAGIGVDVLYVVTGHRAPFAAEQQRADYVTPARQLAGDIAAMALSQADADLLLSFAKRLDSNAVEDSRGRTRMEMPATADNAKAPHEVKRRRDSGTSGQKKSA
jgi:transcriptional regulator with XRE-family HTH domain